MTNPSEFLWNSYPVIKAKERLETILQAVSGATCGKLGNFFGGVSGAAITVRYNKVAEQLAGDKKLKRKVDKIKNRIFNI